MVYCGNGGMGSSSPTIYMLPIDKICGDIYTFYRAFYRRVRRLSAPSVNHLQMRNRRGEHCSPGNTFDMALCGRTVCAPKSHAGMKKGRSMSVLFIVRI